MKRTKRFVVMGLLSSMPVLTCGITAQAQFDEPNEPEGSLAWVRTGGPLGGLGYDVRMRPDDPNVMFVTDAWAGIFKSTDAGQTWAATNTGIEAGKSWQSINNGLDDLYICTLFMHPENPDILLAGGATGVFEGGGGVYLTTDGGLNWRRTLEYGANAVEFALSDPNIAYAGNPESIYRSTDGGWN